MICAAGTGIAAVLHAATPRRAAAVPRPAHHVRQLCSSPLQHGQLDPAVMSTLPPSVALDLMMKMRERSQAENRQEFEARRAAPAAFSSFQMQTYLAGTRFRLGGG